MSDQRAMPPAVLASMLLHVAVVAIARPTATLPPGAPASVAETEPVDIWAGDTASLPGSGRAQPSAAEEDAARRAVQAPPSSPEPVAPARVTGAERGAARADAAATTPASRPARPSSGAPQHSEAKATRPRPRGSDGGARRDGDDGQDGGDFGAEGSSAVRSLGRAFTRAVPPACQADATWGALPAGSAGAARFVVEVDGAGHIASWKHEGDERPPRHLENLMKRTIALLGSGTFAVGRGAVTAGRQTLEIGATVRDGGTEDGIEAAADLAWRFENGRGKAAFAQAGGRHVEVTIRVVRTEVATTPPPG